MEKLFIIHFEGTATDRNGKVEKTNRIAAIFKSPELAFKYLLDFHKDNGLPYANRSFSYTETEVQIHGKAFRFYKDDIVKCQQTEKLILSTEFVTEPKYCAQDLLYLWY